MRKVLLVCVAVGSASLGVAGPAGAQVVITAPGVAIEAGPQPYWRANREAEWRDRREFHEAESRHVEWQRDHCVKDWGGHAYCR